MFFGSKQFGKSYRGNDVYDGGPGGGGETPPSFPGAAANIQTFDVVQVTGLQSYSFNGESFFTAFIPEEGLEVNSITTFFSNATGAESWQAGLYDSQGNQLAVSDFTPVIAAPGGIANTAPLIAPVVIDPLMIYYVGTWCEGNVQQIYFAGITGFGLGFYQNSGQAGLPAVMPKTDPRNIYTWSAMWNNPA